MLDVKSQAKARRTAFSYICMSFRGDLNAHEALIIKSSIWSNLKDWNSSAQSLQRVMEHLHLEFLPGAIIQNNMFGHFRVYTFDLHIRKHDKL